MLRSLSTLLADFERQQNHHGSEDDSKRSEDPAEVLLAGVEEDLSCEDACCTTDRHNCTDRDEDELLKFCQLRSGVISHFGAG